MHQRKYTLELIPKVGIGGAKPDATSLEINVLLTTKQFDKHTKTSGKHTPIFGGFSCINTIFLVQQSSITI